MLRTSAHRLLPPLPHTRYSVITTANVVIYIHQAHCYQHSFQTAWIWLQETV